MIWRRPFVSARATPTGDAGLAVLPSAGVGRVSHWVRVPGGACPVSGNPIVGLVAVSYAPHTVVVELVSLRRFVRNALRRANSVERLALALHGPIAEAVGVPVKLDLWLLVRPGPQVYRVQHG